MNLVLLVGVACGTLVPGAETVPRSPAALLALRRNPVPRSAFAAFLVFAACHAAPPPAPVAPLPAPDEPTQPNEATPEVLHARGVAILTAAFAPDGIPSGDIFVTWTPKPELYATVTRTDSTVVSSLVSTDGVVGTAEAVWQKGRQREVHVRWTKRADTLMELRARVQAGVVHFAGVRDTALQVPALPWAIADYGMEDQLLPLIEAAAADTHTVRLAIYRPYQAKWDTIDVACRRSQGVTLATETTPDGEHFFWTITADGALVRLTRDRNPGFERRPLELTRRAADYARLSKIWGH